MDLHYTIKVNKESIISYIMNSLVIDEKIRASSHLYETVLLQFKLHHSLKKQTQHICNVVLCNILFQESRVLIDGS